MGLQSIAKAATPVGNLGTNHRQRGPGRSNHIRSAGSLIVFFLKTMTQAIKKPIWNDRKRQPNPLMTVGNPCPASPCPKNNQYLEYLVHDQPPQGSTTEANPQRTYTRYGRIRIVPAGVSRGIGILSFARTNSQPCRPAGLADNLPPRSHCAATSTASHLRKLPGTCSPHRGVRERHADRCWIGANRDERLLAVPGEPLVPRLGAVRRNVLEEIGRYRKKENRQAAVSLGMPAVRGTTRRA